MPSAAVSDRALRSKENQRRASFERAQAAMSGTAPRGTVVSFRSPQRTPTTKKSTNISRRQSTPMPNPRRSTRRSGAGLVQKQEDDAEQIQKVAESELPEKLSTSKAISTEEKGDEENRDIGNHVNPQPEVTTSIKAPEYQPPKQLHVKKSAQGEDVAAASPSAPHGLGIVDQKTQVQVQNARETEMPENLAHKENIKEEKDEDKLEFSGPADISTYIQISEHQRPTQVHLNTREAGEASPAVTTSNDSESLKLMAFDTDEFAISMPHLPASLWTEPSDSSNDSAQLLSSTSSVKFESPITSRSLNAVVLMSHEEEDVMQVRGSQGSEMPHNLDPQVNMSKNEDVVAGNQKVVNFVSSQSVFGGPTEISNFSQVPEHSSPIQLPLKTMEPGESPFSVTAPNGLTHCDTESTVSTLPVDLPTSLAASETHPPTSFATPTHLLSTTFSEPANGLSVGKNKDLLLLLLQMLLGVLIAAASEQSQFCPFLAGMTAMFLVAFNLGRWTAQD